MNKPSTLLLTFLACSLSLTTSQAQAQTTLTTAQALSLYATDAPARVSVHDPSVVWDGASHQYYIFGSHRAQARTTDLYHWTFITPAIPWGTADANGTVTSGVTNQEAFVHPEVRSLTTAQGKTITLPDFDAAAWAAQGSAAGYNVDGNMWAPDIIYNKVMKKWCQYLSINGDHWASSIILLTADNIEGPYVYQGPVVIGGFNGTNANSYKNTDLEQVIGRQASLPQRYNRGSQWGTTWPNNIDPCVFYDHDGQLWMSYGSWSGGIFILKLDSRTGLRDYDAVYPLTGSGNNYTSDPYFGKKIAGGNYVSGEGSYIHRIGQYYYLFLSYGGLTASGGYEMEVFRSENPDGPYTDPRGTSAIYTSYQLNFGPGATARGEKILGAYEDWGFMTTRGATPWSTAGELSQGHNSVITDSLGRTLLVYHTRFNDGSEGHSVRVHQLFTTQNGWLVAAPFEFTGETITNDSIATRQPFSARQLAGTYRVLIHKQVVDHKNKETVKPLSITLGDDGRITGDLSGTWSLTEGTAYLRLTLGGTVYQAVVTEQQMEPYTIRAITFTGVSGAGVAVWGYKMEDRYALAYLLRTATMPVRDGQTISQNVNLYGVTDGYDNVSVAWTSSHPDILSPEGHYNPSAMTESTTPVDLVMTLTAGDCQYRDTISVSVHKTTIPASADYTRGTRAYYCFDDRPLVNAFNTSEEATFGRQSTTAYPALESDHERSGQFVHTRFGANGHASYVTMPNPLEGEALADGLTVSFWTKLPTANLWDCLFSFYNPLTQKRLYITGNTYVGYNNNAGNWIDLNHPDTVTTGNIATGRWTLVTLTLSRSAGVQLYINGAAKAISTVNGSQNGKAITSRSQFDYNEMVDFVAQCHNMYLGFGSFWGSADALFDDLMVYNRVLSRTDVRGLNMAENRVTDFAATGITTIGITPKPSADHHIYNLQGQRMGDNRAMLPRGIYIQDGQKFIKR